jgi:hypothetical protein
VFSPEGDVLSAGVALSEFRMLKNPLDNSYPEAYGIVENTQDLK